MDGERSPVMLILKVVQDLRGEMVEILEMWRFLQSFFGGFQVDREG